MSPLSSYRMRLGHLPIIDRNERLLGYRLVYGAECATDPAWLQRLDTMAIALLEMLASLGKDARPGDRFLALPVGPGALNAPALAQLDPAGLVLHWPTGMPIDVASATRLAALRRKGFRLWLGGSTPALVDGAALPAPDWMEVDASAESATPLRRTGTSKLIATDASDPDRQAAWKQRGADAFVGYHFLRQAPQPGRKLAPSYRVALKALSLVEREADIEEVEAALEQDPTLTFKLLRFMNTAGVGGARRIDGLRDAVSLIGYRKLSRWLGLILVTAAVESGPQALLARTAIVRARTMEMLVEAGQNSMPRDPAFLTGLFSLLDVLTGVPLAHLVDELGLAEDIASALSDRSGPLGQHLALVESCEHPTLARLDFFCDALEVDPLVLAAAQVSAIAMSEAIASGG